MNTHPARRALLRDLGFDANRIAPRLYQGSRPPPGAAAGKLFGVLVFCAKEFQPASLAYPGAHVIRCPLNDDGTPMTGDEWVRARATAAKVAILVLGGARALVTCHAGINRSGLVSALTLRILEARPGAACLEHVRRARPGALTNPYFSAALRAA